MIDLFAHLILALSAAAVVAGRLEGRYVAAATSAMLLAISAYLGLPIGVVIAVVALSLSLDWRMGPLALPWRSPPQRRFWRRMSTTPGRRLCTG
jgi:hypothetical protein